MFRLLLFVASAWLSPSVLACEIAVQVEKKNFAYADRLASRALRRRKAHPLLLEQYALSAHNAGRYASARVRWEALHALDDTHAMAWAGIACNLRELGRVDEAADVITDALSRFPDNTILRSEAVRIFRNGKVERLAMERLTLITPSEQDDLDWFESYTEVVLRSLPLDQSTILIVDVSRGASNHPGWLLALSLLAFRSGEWRHCIELSEAAQANGAERPRLKTLASDALHLLATEAENARWGRPEPSLANYDFILDRRQDVATWFFQRADTLIKLGRLSDAECELDRLERQFPNEVAAKMVRSRLFAKQGKWDDALSMITQYLLAHPSDAEAIETRAHFVAERNYETGARTASAVVSPLLQDVGFEEDRIKRDLLLNFESLGEDCEFGLVQRRYGAEPIGLFRWNSTRVDNLAAALRERLLDIGKPEYTLMSTWADVEYYVADTRWGFGFHTFRTQQEIAYDDLYPRMCKRLTYLRDKFLEDLRTGAKTFIFKSDGATFDDLCMLQSLLSTDTPCDLVCVKQVTRSPNDDIPVLGGSVFRVSDRIYIGYVTRFGYREVKWDILFDDWIKICEGFSSSADLPFSSTLI